MWQSRPRCRQCTGASFAQDMRFLNVFVGTCFEFFAKIQVFRSIISAYSNKADLPANWPSRRKDLKYLSTIFNCLSTLVFFMFFFPFCKSILKGFLFGQTLSSLSRSRGFVLLPTLMSDNLVACPFLTLKFKIFGQAAARTLNLLGC